MEKLIRKCIRKRLKWDLKGQMRSKGEVKGCGIKEVHREEGEMGM